MDCECEVRLWRMMGEVRGKHGERRRYMDKKGLKMAVAVYWFWLHQVRSFLTFGRHNTPTVGLASFVYFTVSNLGP